MLKRHETDMVYYAGARDAFLEFQRFANKMLEKVAVYEAETMDDMHAAFMADEKTRERANGEREETASADNIAGA